MFIFRNKYLFLDFYNKIGITFTKDSVCICFYKTRLINDIRTQYQIYSMIPTLNIQYFSFVLATKYNVMYLDKFLQNFNIKEAKKIIDKFMNKHDDNDGNDNNDNDGNDNNDNDDKKINDDNEEIINDGNEKIINDDNGKKIINEEASKNISEIGNKINRKACGSKINNNTQGFNYRKNARNFIFDIDIALFLFFYENQILYIIIFFLIVNNYIRFLEKHHISYKYNTITLVLFPLHILYYCQ